MEGGYFLGQGADTCVFAPPVDCVQPGIPPGDNVSRIVPISESYEEYNQQVVRRALLSIHDKIDQSPQAQMWLMGRPLDAYFNFAIGTCIPSFKESDLKNIDGSPHSCQQHIALGRNNQFLNFITPRQDADLIKKSHPLPETLREIRPIFHVLLLLNAEGILHADIHYKNVAWMGNHIVLHDWGRVLDGVTALTNHLTFHQFGDANVRRQFTHQNQFMQLVGPAMVMGVSSYIPHQPKEYMRFMRVFDIAGLLATVMFVYPQIGGDTANSRFLMPLRDLLNTAASPDEITKGAHAVVDDFLNHAIARVTGLPPPSPPVSAPIVRPLPRPAILRPALHPAPMPLPPVAPPPAPVRPLHPAPVPLAPPRINLSSRPPRPSAAIPPVPLAPAAAPAAAPNNSLISVAMSRIFGPAAPPPAQPAPVPLAPILEVVPAQRRRRGSIGSGRKTLRKLV